MLRRITEDQLQQRRNQYSGGLDWEEYIQRLEVSNSVSKDAKINDLNYHIKELWRIWLEEKVYNYDEIMEVVKESVDQDNECLTKVGCETISLGELDFSSWDI